MNLHERARTCLKLRNEVADAKGEMSVDNSRAGHGNYVVSGLSGNQ